MSKEFQPTDEQRTFVRMAVVAGFKQDDICKGVINPETENPISKHTLEKHFRKEIDTGMLDAGVRVVGSLYQNALDGDTTAAIWYTKARLGWKGTDVSERVGKDGGAIQHEHTLSEEALALLKANGAARSS